MIPGHEVVGIVLATISALRHLGFSGEIWGIEKNEKLSGKLFINGGVDMAFECVGTADAVDLALRITKPLGKIVIAGTVSNVSIDLAPIFSKELEY